MIKKIYIKNYKCYKDSSLNLKDITVIVGNNNAGKSTLIEALRIISYAAGKYKNALYVEMPKEFKLPIRQKGFKIPVSNLMIDLRTALYQFEGAFAQIDVSFDTKEHIIVYLNSQVAYACIQDKNGNFITSKSKANTVTISVVNIMPQLGLIKDIEKRITKETVEKNLGTRLSSRHFRNELLLFKNEHFNDFVQLAQSTWDGLRIQNLEQVYGEDPITLLVYDGSFCAEIGNMGSGLQMWLQIIWFLSRCSYSDTIILDEPDVYMHPDMQLKIYNIVSKRFKQVIIATHSVEIISNVNPQNIVTIDRQTRKFSYANDIKGAQSIIENIGGNQNLSLIRLGSAKKCIFVEGKDLNIITKICDKLFPESKTQIANIPSVQLGGKNNFEEALGTARLFYEETKGGIKTFCILDRDYSTDTEIEKYKTRAKESHLLLHIWSKKEIENYIVTPEIVFSASGLTSDKKSELFNKIEKAIEPFKVDIVDRYAKRILESASRGAKDIVTINQEARKIVDEKWTDLESKMALMNGKDLIKLTRDILKNDYSIEIRQTDLLESINMSNISKEFADVLCEIMK